MTNLGIVAIGRNEGERLKRCLDSVQSGSYPVVYVDSGSTDDSLSIARACRATAVELDLGAPFTAARARNAGFQQLMQLHPRLDYVFFVDGDCEVAPEWLEKARVFLDAHGDVAVVSGLRRERFPDKSIYNLIIDLEWREYPFGDVRVCGGDAFVRVDAFRQVNGYRSDLICGEEPEMCVRLRRAGWRIWRLEEAMSLHDAAMYRFHQWWMREVRTGFAFAQGASLHGAAPERHSVYEARRAWLWGLGIPVVIGIIAVSMSEWGLWLFAIYPLQVIRLAQRGKLSAREKWSRSAALVLGKFPEMLGQVKYFFNRARGAQSRLIEYK